MKKSTLKTLALMLCGLMLLTTLNADPCGMVPPIYTGNQSPISRIGLQKTYVFHKDGVETFVIRPGFSGKVDNFGMLIPFPNPPELRKVADDVFEQIANAVDPPEVVVDLRVRRMMMQNMARGAGAPTAAADKKLSVAKNQVAVLKEEAVGMYEVAVLQAGSPEALKKWMDKNGYKYPDGMDKVTNDYVENGWCFVAVKTKVGEKKGVDPQPGQRKIRSELPSGSVFDGNVQGMGFRFKSEKLVVPMRLSAFNDGDLRNVMYLLTDGPRKVRSIPEEYIVRQIPGQQLYDNVTQLLPLRIIGGTEKDIPPRQRETLPKRRDPEPKNGIAKDLFAADLLAVSSGNLSLQHEEEEKELLRIGEHFGLRGGEVDKENREALADARKKTVEGGLALLKDMTLTVVDGDFPRQVIAKENLTFADYKMPGGRNNSLNYDAKAFGPGVKRDGVLKVGKVDWNNVEQQIARDHFGMKVGLQALIGFGLVGMLGMLTYRRPRPVAAIVIAVGLVSSMFAAKASFAAGPTSSVSEIRFVVEDGMLERLQNSKTAHDAIKEIRNFAAESESNRDKIIAELLVVVKKDESLAKRGWAIAALADIGGQDVDEYLLDVHADENQKQPVRTWAAAARVKMTMTVNGLIEKANLIQQFPGLGRPIGLRIVEKLTKDSASADPEKVVSVTQKVPQLQTALAPTIMAYGPEKLADVMFSAKDQNVRRTTAGYLAAMAQQGESDNVAKVVIQGLQFDSMSDDVPWINGPLFVPGIQWNKQDARSLVGQLVRWMVWCDVKGKSNELKQIHNNIRSLGLARAAGYNSPGWNDVNCASWLKAWGAVVGREGIATLLEEQGVEKNDNYSSVLSELN